MYIGYIAIIRFDWGTVIVVLARAVSPPLNFGMAPTRAGV